MSPYGHKVEFYFSACPGRSRYISQTRTDQRDCGCVDTLLALYTSETKSAHFVRTGDDLKVNQHAT